MGLFGSGKLKQTVSALQAQLNTLQRLNNTTQFAASQAVFPTFDIKQVADRYCNTDDIYSIIRRLSTTSALIPMYAYEEKNAPSAKKLKHFSPTGKPWEQKLLQIKALEDLDATDPVYDLLENPSDNLSKFEFYEAAYSMLYLHGECIIYKERGEVRNTPRKLHVLFPQFVVMNVSGKFPQTVISYNYVIDGFTVMANIPPEDIIHIRYFNPHYSITGTELRGLSPLKVLARRLTLNDSEIGVTAAQLQNGGVNTIVYMKDVTEADAAVVGSHKDNFHRFTANTANTGSVYWAGGEMAAIPLGLKLADMEVAAVGKINFKKMCNAYSVSDRLFNNDATGSEVSDDNSRKALYTDACLPNAFRLAAALQNGLAPDFPDKRRVVHADISEIPELQENMKELAEWLNLSPQITWNERRELQKFDRIDNPLFDMPFIPTGLQTIEDFTAVEDLVDPLNEYGKS